MTWDEVPEPGIKVLGRDIFFLIGMASGSLISATTTSQVRKVLATEAACCKLHLTTCSNL